MRRWWRSPFVTSTKVGWVRVTFCSPVTGGGGWVVSGAGGGLFGEDVGSGFVVARAFGEQVPDGCEDGVLVGDDGLDFAAADDDPLRACPEVAVLGVAGFGEGGYAQGPCEVAVAGMGFGGLDPAGGFVGAGTESGPGGQASGV